MKPARPEVGPYRNQVRKPAFPFRAPWAFRCTLVIGTFSFSRTIASAQTNPTLPPADEVVQLSPYEVNTQGDRGYGTSTGLGGTRINLPLIDSSMTIINLNKEFLEDLGFTQLSDEVQFV